MTLSREEIAVRVLQGFAAFEGPCDPKNYAATAVEWSDALLRALTLTPAPVAPPAGKYEPRPGDVVRFVVYGQTNGDGVVVAIQREGVASIRLFGESVHALTWGRYFRDLAYLRPATPSELAAAGLAVPPPATAGEGPASIARRAIESVVTGWDATMIDEAVARVVGATPAPEAKRPEWVRYVKSGSDAVIARPVLRWEGANPVVPSSDGAKGLDHSYTFHLLPDEWVACDAPAPCPPPVAGSDERPEIVCLCGSTRFKDAFLAETKRLTLAGKIVLSVGCFPHTDDGASPEAALGEDVKRGLDALHLRKIDLAGSVHVVNVGGYIGSSTKREIQYARDHGKPVTWMEEPSATSRPVRP